MATADEYRQELDALIARADADGWELWLGVEVYDEGSCCRSELNLESVDVRFCNAERWVTAHRAGEKIEYKSSSPVNPDTYYIERS